MDKLCVLIVDDEPLIRGGIRQHLAEMGGVEVVGECGSVTEACHAIRSERPDLVLLDVRLTDGTGFDVVRRIGPQKMPLCVFITAYDEYAIEAFEVNAVDYLLKPFDDERFRKSIDRARERLAGPVEDLRQRLEAVLEHSAGEKFPQRLVIRNKERFDLVSADTIRWIESANNYVQLHCGAKDYLLGESLSSLERRLDPEKFLRVHRCFIVSLAYVSAVHSIAGGAYEIELRGGTRIKSGRQYRDVLQKLIRA